MKVCDFVVKDTQDQEVNLSDCKGKILLIANTARAAA